MAKNDKERVYITGHKNPDTDSMASAVCYAYLKNKTDDSYDYIPIRCGNVSDQTKYIFENAEVKPPIFVKDVYPKVKNNMTKNVVTVKENDPVSLMLKHIREYSIRFTPVVDEDNNFVSMAGISDLTDLFVRDDRAEKPLFTLRSDTLRRSLRAVILNVGELEEFEASIVVTTMDYNSFHDHIANVADIKKTILITGNRKNILNDVLKMDFPAIVIVGMKDDFSNFSAEGYKGWVFASPFDSAQTIRCVEMATPVKKIVENKVLATLAIDDYLDKAAEMISEINIKALPVVDNNKLVGIVTSTDILKKRKQKLILMDHNEITQAIDGAEVADIIEIIDHHRLGTIKTMTPINFYAKPVGSTCTLVYQLYKTAAIAIPHDLAKLLLGGVLSDTVILKSPTTTPEDISACKELSEVSGCDIKDYGIKIFSATDSLSQRSTRDIVITDFKIFEEFDKRIGIAQVETVTLQEVPSLRDSIILELEKLNNEHKLNWSMLLVTDIIMEESELITTSFPVAEKLFKYKNKDIQTYSLPGILSRKKQLLPEVLRILEELSN